MHCFKLRLQGNDALSEDEWRLIVNSFPASCAIGYQVVVAELAHEPDESVHEFLGDILRIRQQALWSCELAIL